MSAARLDVQLPLGGADLARPPTLAAFSAFIDNGDTAKRLRAAVSLIAAFRS